MNKKSIISNIEIMTDYNNLKSDQKNRNINSAFINRKISNQEHRPINVKVYNATINSLSEKNFFLNKINKIKSPKTSKKKIHDHKYILKQKAFNLSNNLNNRGFDLIRRNEIRTVESMYNLLNINSNK